MKLGQRVKTRVSWSGVPAGTEGVVDEHYDGGVMIAWDGPPGHAKLPANYTAYDGRPACASMILRDGFCFDDLKYLDVIPTPSPHPD